MWGLDTSQLSKLLAVGVFFLCVAAVLIASTHQSVGGPPMPRAEAVNKKSIGIDNRKRRKQLLTIVKYLNREFQAHPTNASAAEMVRGVLMSTAPVESGIQFPCGNCDNTVGGPGNADCTVFASLYNRQWAVAKREWAHREGRKKFTYAKRGQLMTTFNWFHQDGSKKRKFALVYNLRGIMKAIRCSFPFAGHSFTRLNHGCGRKCEPFLDSDPEPGGEKGCACRNTDASTGREYLFDSEEIDGAHCKNLTAPMIGRYDRVVNIFENNCYWKGPSFYGGIESNELRQMVEHRLHVERTQNILHGVDSWTEVLISVPIQEKLLADDITSVIMAFVIPDRYCDKHCRLKVTEISLQQAEKYGLAEPLPIVGFDDLKPEAPFHLV